jgi:SAM-dependent methyltransferase
LKTNQKNPIQRYGSKDSEEYKYFANDFQPGRERHWLSLWLQAAPVIMNSDVHSVLEFGGGRDVTRSLARHFGVEYKSIDISDRFFPDTQSSIADYAFEGRTYDLVCSFQCLEHNPWDESLELIAHMAKFTHKYLYLSVPYSGGWFSFSYSLRLPKISWQKSLCFVFDGFGGRSIDVDALKSRPPERKYAAHWWEVGRPGLSRKKFISAVERKGFRLVESQHNKLLPHHLFLLFVKREAS